MLSENDKNVKSVFRFHGDLQIDGKEKEPKNQVLFCDVSLTCDAPFGLKMIFNHQLL